MLKGTEKERMMNYIENGEHFMLEYASEELKNDKEFIMKAVEKEPYAIQFASNQLQRDTEVLEKVFKNIEVNDEVDLNNLKYMLSDYGYDLYRILPEPLRNNKELAEFVFEHSGSRQTGYFGSKLQDDKEFILDTMKKCRFINLNELSDKMKKDPDILNMWMDKKERIYLEDLEYVCKTVPDNKNLVDKAFDRFSDFKNYDGYWKQGLDIVEKYTKKEQTLDNVIKDAEFKSTTPEKTNDKELERGV